jgi:hypothetical protein
MGALPHIRLFLFSNHLTAKIQGRASWKSAGQTLNETTRRVVLCIVCLARHLSNEFATKNVKCLRPTLNKLIFFSVVSLAAHCRQQSLYIRIVTPWQQQLWLRPHSLGQLCCCSASSSSSSSSSADTSRSQDQRQNHLSTKRSRARASGDDAELQRRQRRARALVRHESPLRVRSEHHEDQVVLRAVPPGFIRVDTESKGSSNMHHRGVS